MYSRKPEVVEKEEGRAPETSFYSFVAFPRPVFVPHFYLTFLIIHRCTVVVDVNAEFPEENDDAREVSGSGLVAKHKCGISFSYQCFILIFAHISVWMKLFAVLTSSR